MTSKWQPIETAPKDGTVILIARNTGRVFVDAAFWRMRDGDNFPWVALDSDDPVGVDGWTAIAPTHWMPLPDGPVQP